MGLPNEVNSALIGAAAAGGYTIDQSLRFESSAYLYRSPSSAGNQNVWTISLWAKRGQLGSQQDMYSAGTGGTDILYWTSSDQIAVDAPALSVLVSNDRFRDPSAWYHIVMAVDATNGTNSNRTRIYVNNREVTSWATDARGSLTSNKYLTNSTTRHTLGIRSSDLSGTPYKGYESEFYLIDGQQLTPSDFGEYDDNGVWRPKAYAGTYGTNGVHLTFDSAGIGNDSGTNGHNWSHTGFTTSGTGTDVMSDTPTTNYATLNPIFKVTTTTGGGNIGGGTYANGNLEHSESSLNFRHTISTMALPSSGKVYVEVEADTLASSYGSIFGLMLESKLNYPDDAANFGVYCQSNGTLTIEGTNQGTVTAGDVFSLSVDMSASPIEIVVRKNGTVVGSNPYTLSTTETLFFWSRNIYGSKLIWNFGQRAFEQTVPSGYKALNTSNLPAPDIAAGSTYFDTKLYTGNTSTNAITGFDFSPDLVWLKSRSHSSDQVMYDIIRGPNKELRVNTNNTEWSFTDSLNSFDSGGFTLGSDTGNGNVNLSSRTYVAWCWDAGSSNSTNTSGTITSTVRANPSAGFSIVTYTGNGSSNQTVGHGLGVAPDVVILKARNATRNWYVQHKDFTDRTYFGYLNDSGTPYAGPSGNSPFDNGTFNSTVFSVNETGNSETGNGNTETYVAYCFAEIEGYSKFGEYIGNGSLDGPFVYCGFRPAFVMIKREDGSGEWFMVDTARNTYNPSDQDLFANFSYTETSSSGKDLLSNGFKIRETGASMNASGGSFIFMAFAEHPFGGSTVSPATAR